MSCSGRLPFLFSVPANAAKKLALEITERNKRVDRFKRVFGLRYYSKMNRLQQIMKLDSCSIEKTSPIFRGTLSPRQIHQFTKLSNFFY